MKHAHFLFATETNCLPYLMIFPANCAVVFPPVSGVWKECDQSHSYARIYSPNQSADRESRKHGDLWFFDFENDSDKRCYCWEWPWISWNIICFGLIVGLECSIRVSFYPIVSRDSRVNNVKPFA